MTRPIVYFAHPLRGDVRDNVHRALRWLHWLMRSEPEVAFVAPWLACVACGVDDSDPAQRERGMLDNLAIVSRCDGIVLCGDRVSDGMKREMRAAIQSGLYVCDLTRAGIELDSAPTVPGVLDRYRTAYRLDELP